MLPEGLFQETKQPWSKEYFLLWKAMSSGGTKEIEVRHDYGVKRDDAIRGLEEFSKYGVPYSESIFLHHVGHKGGRATYEILIKINNVAASNLCPSLKEAHSKYQTRLLLRQVYSLIDDLHADLQEAANEGRAYAVASLYDYSDEHIPLPLALKFREMICAVKPGLRCARIMARSYLVDNSYLLVWTDNGRPITDQLPSYFYDFQELLSTTAKL